MSILKVGLVGLGTQTNENILPSLLQIPDVRIVAACDNTAGRADTIRRYVKDADIFTDVELMLHRCQLDAIVVACPPQAHRDIALSAMTRHIHVFVEKPPCFTLAELEQLIAIAQEQQVVTATGMNFRFARPIRHLRDIASHQEFGRTVHAQINHYASKPRAPMWGLDSTLRSFLLAQAIHSIDLAIVFGGAEIDDIHANIQWDAGALLANIHLTFASGMAASLFTGSMFPYFEFDMKLVSHHSTMVHLDNLWNITLHEVEHNTRSGGNDKRWRGAWQPGPLDSGYIRSGYQGELEDFFHAIRHNKKFEADFASLLPTYKVIEQVCALDTTDATITKEVRAKLSRLRSLVGNDPIAKRVVNHVR